MENVSGWSGGCEVQGVSSDITVLETSIHHHQALYETMCQAYTEVYIQMFSCSCNYFIIDDWISFFSCHYTFKYFWLLSGTTKIYEVSDLKIVY